MMTTISNIFQEYGPEYLSRYAGKMPRQHEKVIDAIIDCRTRNCGHLVYECRKCGSVHRVFRSCGNRHCPTCQNQKTRKWLEKRMRRQLPGHHFMITFTVPEELRRFIRSNQRQGYAALFSASADTLKILARDPDYIGGDLTGFFGVLHTWGRQLQYHPHIHYVVAGGALSKSDGKWHPSGIGFYLPVKAMSKIFKAKFKDIMKKNNLYQQIPSELWDKSFNVNCQAVGSSKASVKYLSPYVFKVAISNSRILKLEDRKVTFRYKKPKSQRWRTTTLEVMEFIRRFLQHVLPKGFMKIRYYGFMSSSCSVPHETITALIELSSGFTVVLPDTQLEPVPEPVCKDCGGSLKLLYFVLPHEMMFMSDTG
jgi:hypothetical protein